MILITAAENMRNKFHTPCPLYSTDRCVSWITFQWIALDNPMMAILSDMMWLVIPTLDSIRERAPFVVR